MMRVRSSILVMAVALAATAVGVPLRSAAEDADARVSTQSLLEAHPWEIEPSLGPWMRERTQVCSALLKIASDETRDVADRRAATAAMRRVPTLRIVRHCVRTIGWYSPEEETEAGGPFANRPSMQTLADIGYAAIPGILHELRHGLSLEPESHAFIAEVLELICGRDAARAILLREKSLAGEAETTAIDTVLAGLEQD